MVMKGLEVGTIVLHPKRPKWGPGKVLAALAGGIAVIYFRDLPEEKRGDAVKKISTNHVSLVSVQALGCWEFGRSNSTVR